MALTMIDGYEVMYSDNQYPPRVWLKSGTGYIGQLIFRPDGSTLPPDSGTGTNVNLYYHLQDLQNILDLLRNEKPMYLLYNGSGNENGIKTTREPVGEEESSV